MPWEIIVLLFRSRFQSPKRKWTRVLEFSRFILLTFYYEFFLLINSRRKVVSDKLEYMKKPLGPI